MKIGINASFLRKPQTGIGQVTLNFLKTLAKTSAPGGPALGGKTLEFILYLEKEPDKYFDLPKNFQTSVFLPFWKRDDLIRKIWWEKYLLPKKVREDGCDVFLSLYQCPTVLNGNIKHIMLVHDLIPKLFSEYLNNFRKKIYQKLTENAIKKTDKIMAVSKRTEKDLIRCLEISGEKITVNYIDIDEIYKKPVSEKNIQKVLKKYKLSPGYILNGGGMEVRKNTEGVIRAYHILWERNKKEKFIDELPKLIIWGKLLPQLAPLTTDAEKLAKELNLAKQIKLLDAVPQNDLPALYKNCSVFIYPSFYEGFGLPVLEAMSQGKPVITSKNSSLPEVGLDSILYCDPDNIQEMAKMLKKVLLDENLRELLSRKAEIRAKEFSWEIFVKKTINVILSVSEESRDPSLHSG